VNQKKRKEKMPIDDNGWKEMIRTQGEDIHAIREGMEDLAKELYLFKGRVLGWAVAVSGIISVVGLIVGLFL